MHLTHHNFVIAIKMLLLAVICGVASSSYAATLSVSPGTGVYTAGQTFTARVVVNTSGKNINAAEGKLSFKPGELSVVRVTKGSIFNLWTAEPSFSNSAGTISFSGGSPTGYTGSGGSVISVTFRTKGAGNPRVSFTSGAVLAADGRGTNVLTSMNGGSFTIVSAEVSPEPETIEYIAPANTPAAPVINSKTHPEPEGWYTEKSAELSWALPAGVTAVRTRLDENSGSIPTKVYDTPISSISLSDLDEGVQYFHMQFRNGDGWGRVAHYRIAIDSKPPTSFKVTLSEGVDLTSPIQTLVLKTEDDTSAVVRFLIQIDGGEPFEFIDEDEKGQLVLPSLEPGHHSVIIEAFDSAGNSLIDSISFGVLAFDKPQFTEYPSEVSKDVIPVIKGITRPNAEVKVLFTKIGSDTQEISILSSETGEFIFIPEGRLSLGVYELSAVAVDERGAQSEMSDVVRIAVQQPGYIRIGSVVVSILSVLIPLLALTILSILGLWFLFVRLRRLRTGVTRETDEALVMLGAEFEALRKVVRTHSDLLSSSRKTKKLTKAEAVLIEAVEEALQSAQKKVEKEITDVEKIVE
ncbi:MAG: hypothetical protein ACI92I_000056 [Acidimicrobiales bacterium]|jgi:hypothetical protein